MKDLVLIQKDQGCSIAPVTREAYETSHWLSYLNCDFGDAPL